MQITCEFKGGFSFQVNIRLFFVIELIIFFESILILDSSIDQFIRYDCWQLKSGGDTKNPVLDYTFLTPHRIVAIMTFPIVILKLSHGKLYLLSWQNINQIALYAAPYSHP